MLFTFAATFSMQFKYSSVCYSKITTGESGKNGDKNENVDLI